MQAEREIFQVPPATPPRPYFRFVLPLSVVLLLASLVFHLLVDVHTSLQAQWQGVGLILVSILAVLAMGIAFPATALPNMLPRVPWPGRILLLLTWIFFYLVFLKEPGPWSEEVWWAELGRSIANGSLVNPIGFKGDHPANFQAWPVAFFFLLTGDPIFSARLPGALYAPATVFFVILTVALYCRVRSVFSCWVLGLLSVSLLHYSQSGWNEMNSVPLLISVQFYLLSRALLYSCRRSLILLALFAGLGFWSLYTPALFSLIATGFVLIARKTTLSFRMKALWLLCFLLIAAPTFGKMLHHSFNSLARHEAFLKGGEWTPQFNESYRPLPTYFQTLYAIWWHILPGPSSLHREALLQINLEGTTMLLFMAGLLWGLWGFDRYRKLLLYGSTILLVIGITLTNPGGSTWREFCFWSPLMIFALIGLQILLSRIEKVSPVVGASAVALLLCAHVYIFGMRYLQSRVGAFGEFASYQAKRIFEELAPQLEGSRTYYFSNSMRGWFARLLASSAREKLAYHTFSSLSQLDRGLENSLIVTMAGDETNPSAEDVVGMLSAAGLSFHEIKVSGNNTALGSIIVVK